MPSDRDARTPATIIDVANEAKVSIKTVSRVLNGEPNVRALTRDRVLSAVNKLNYKINHSARNLRSRRANLIALFCDNPSRSYVGDVQLGVMRTCVQAGFHLVVEHISDKAASIQQFFDDAPFAGAILTPPMSDDLKVLDTVERIGVPYVRIAPIVEAERSSHVRIDDFGAAKRMTHYLFERGHDRIGFITGHPEHLVSEVRYRGFLDALEEAGVPFDKQLIKSGEFSYLSGLRAAEQFFRMANAPTAIFASNDDMAAGVMAAAYKRGLRIPEDLSLVGFDDTPIASVVSPCLTTVRQPISQMAEIAAELLIRRVQNPEGEIESVTLDYQIVERDSVATRRKLRAGAR